MIFEKLHHLIHFTANEHKNRFPRYMRGRTKTDYYLLYRRILKEKVIGRETEKKIRGVRFANHQKYYAYRDELARLIVWSEVENNKKEVPILAFIKIAFLHGLDELAVDSLQSEMIQRQNAEDFHFLVYVYQFLADLKNKYQISVVLDKGIKSIDFCRAQIANRKQLENIMVRIRLISKLPPSQREKLLLAEMKLIPGRCGCRTNQNIVRKILMSTSLLLGRFEQAFSWGERLLKHIRKFPQQYPAMVVASEMAKLAMNALILNDREKTVRITMHFGDLIAKTPYESEQIFKQKNRLESLIAVSFSEEQMARSCLSRLSVDMFESDPVYMAHRYFHIGLTLFQTENFTEAIECLSIVKENRLKDCRHYSWEPQMLMVLSYIEIGQIDRIENLLRSTSIAIKGNKLKYPLFCASFIKSYLNAPKLEQSLFLQNALKYIEVLIQNPDEKRQSLTLPIRFWIKSKITGAPQKKFVSEEMEALPPESLTFEIG